MPRQPRPPERTSGADARGPRTLEQAVAVFDVDDQLDRLTAEPEWSRHDRNAVTLAKSSSFRVVLVALRGGAQVGEDEAHGPMSVQVVRGAVTVRRSEEAAELSAGQLAAMEAGGPWSVTARDASAILLTISWPEERSLV
jgi:quercetin dioxygenase-like cupin family protein